MRVDRKDEGGPQKPTGAKEPFRKVLDGPRAGQATSPPPQPGPKVATAAARTSVAPPALRALAAATQAVKLGEARTQATHQVQQRVQHRAEGLEANQERQQQRVLELIRCELSRDAPQEARRDPSPLPDARVLPERGGPPRDPAADSQVSGAGAASSAVGGKSESPKVEAAAAIELVQRVELFLRSARPAMALQLDGALARVELERTGKNQVALSIQGRAGPPSADELARIREELRARGIEVTALRAR